MPINENLLKSYTESTRSMSTKLLWKEARELRDCAPELAGAAAAELAARGEPKEEPPQVELAPAGFYFARNQTTAGETTTELWDGGRLAATIYAQRGGLQIVFAPGYEPGPLAVEVQFPYGVQIQIERGGRR